MPYRLLLTVVALALASNARAQSPSEQAGRRIVEEAVVELAGPALVRQHERAARRGCDGGEGMSGYEYVDCLTVQLTLAERALTAASVRHEASITEMSAGYPVASGRVAYRERWRSVWAHAQRQWRASRDADCAESVFAYQGGSGATAERVSCLATRTYERAAYLCPACDAR